MFKHCTVMFGVLNNVNILRDLQGGWNFGIFPNFTQHLHTKPELQTRKNNDPRRTGRTREPADYKRTSHNSAKPFHSL